MTPEERKERHQRHQEMLEWHKLRKIVARERHSKKWHRMSIPPIILV